MASGAAMVSNKIRPENVVLAGGQRQDYELGPVPYGMDRASVVRLCKGLNWTAKAINPVRTVAGALGVLWLVQSVTPPPQTVVATKMGEIVITKVNVKEAQAVPPTSVVASSATVTLCAASDRTIDGVDPWLKNDPWQPGISQVSCPKPTAPDAFSHLKEVESRLEQSLLSKLQQPQNMETDATDALESRLQRLEQATDARFGHLELQLTGVQLERRVQDHCTQTSAQFAQFQHQVAAQMDTQSTQISDLFGQQMAKIETLLKKRSSME